MDLKLNISTINLFGILPIDDTSKKTEDTSIDEKTLIHGFIYDGTVKANYTDKELEEMISNISQIIGRNNAEVNSTFHKSWKKIATATTEQLVLEQIMHYITTYGFETLGCFSEDTIYIPNETLNLPDDANLPIIVVKGATLKEIKGRIMTILQTGMALKEKTIEDMMIVISHTGIDADDIATVKNKESRINLYVLTGVVPSNPEEFVRYLVFLATQKASVIKDKRTYQQIKTVMDSNDFAVRISELLSEYDKNYGLIKLSESFNRYKDIYMAFRCTKTNPYINKISKLSKTNHKPMKEDYLNSITKKLLNGGDISLEVLETELSKVNTFRKVRLYNALSYRIDNDGSIVYRVRNGRGFATSLDNSRYDGSIAVIKDVVLDHIIKDIKPLVENKKVFIPEGVHFAMPTSEKQFSGSIPLGSVFDGENNIVIGVQWKNVEGQRIDLDLSLSNLFGKIGWDGYYSSDTKRIMFSGDMTDASGDDGASELFYIGQDTEDSIYLLNLNHYNRSSHSKDVPFKIVMGSEDGRLFNRNHMLDASKIKFNISEVMDTKQKTLGMVYIKDGEKKFILEETSISKGISMKHGDTAQHLLNSMENTMNTRLYLDYILEQAGAILVNDNTDVDYDLSLLSLQKDSILNIIAKVE